MKLGDAAHPKATDYRDADAAVAHGFAIRFANAVKDDPASILRVATWRTELDLALEEVREIVAERQRQVKDSANVEEAEKHRALRHNAALLRELKAAHRRVRDQIDQAARLPEAERGERLSALFKNWVMPAVHIHGETSGQALSAPDWEAVSGELQKQSSEPSSIKLGEALERGKFHTSEHADYPLADVSGRLGSHFVRAQAELTPNAADAAQGEGAAIVQQIAARLADPKLGHGIRTAQTYEALMSAWLTRRDSNGTLNITIGELATMIGYSYDPRRGFDASVFPAVRECTAVLARLKVRAFGLPQLKGFSLPSQAEEFAFSFSFVIPDDDGSAKNGLETWGAIGFRPGQYLLAVLTQKDAYIMGADPGINKLHPRRERAEVLLGKYLERQWRMNLKQEHASVTRTVLALLTDGMGLSDAEAQSARAETLDRLVTALDKLEEQVGTLKHWDGNPQWQAAVSDIDALRARGKYVTKSHWQKLLSARITLEAGTQYQAHYARHSLTYKGGQTVDALAQEFRAYLVRVGRAQATAAAEIGMSASALSRYLAGSVKTISPRARERMEAMIAAEKQGLLPLGTGEV